MNNPGESSRGQRAWFRRSVRTIEPFTVDSLSAPTSLYRNPGLGVRLVVEVTASGGNGKGKGKGLETAPGQNKNVDGYVVRAEHVNGSASHSVDQTGVISTTRTN